MTTTRPILRVLGVIACVPILIVGALVAPIIAVVCE